MMNRDGKVLTRKRKWIRTASEDEDLSSSQNLNSSRGVYSRKRVDSQYPSFPDIRSYAKSSEWEWIRLIDRSEPGLLVCEETNRL